MIGQHVQIADHGVQHLIQALVAIQHQIAGGAGGDHQGVEPAASAERRDDGDRLSARGQRPLCRRKGHRTVDRSGAAGRPGAGPDLLAQLFDLPVDHRIPLAAERAPAWPARRAPVGFRSPRPAPGPAGVGRWTVDCSPHGSVPATAESRPVSQSAQLCANPAWPRRDRAPPLTIACPGTRISPGNRRGHRVRGGSAACRSPSIPGQLDPRGHQPGEQPGGQ